jgi:hypothetical protein
MLVAQCVSRWKSIIKNAFLHRCAVLQTTTLLGSSGPHRCRIPSLCIHATSSQAGTCVPSAALCCGRSAGRRRARRRSPLKCCGGHLFVIASKEWLLPAGESGSPALGKSSRWAAGLLGCWTTGQHCCLAASHRRHSTSACWAIHPARYTARLRATLTPRQATRADWSKAPP